MRKSIGLMAAFILLFSCAAIAQNHNCIIKGFVYDKKTSEPMIYTNVSVRNANTNTGVQTDVNGYFSISLPAGSYTLITTALGYDSSVIEVNLLPDAVVTKKIVITQKEMGLKEVEVSGKRQDRVTHINTGVVNIQPKDLKMLPSSGGEPDVAQYLQVLPGVVFTGDQGGQLYIRGGSPVQTGIYLDGVTIYSPFHSIGLFSVFETEAIRNVDVYTAGFSAQYGNRTSAVIDVHTKDGNKNGHTGIVSASPIMGRFLINGPIYQSKTHTGAGMTYLLAAKHSYLDETSKTLYGGMGNVFKKGLPYKFTDLYGKLTLSGDNGSKLNLFAFNFDDNASLLSDTSDMSIASYHWKARGAGATFVVSPGNSSSLIDGKFAYSNYNSDVQGEQNVNAADTLPGHSQINGFEAAINFTYFLPNYSQLKYGVEVSGLHTSLSYYNAVGLATSEERQSTMAALYFLFRHNFSSRLIFEPSLRIQYYSELNKLSPEPRVGIKYNVSNSVRMKAAAGIYSQNIVGTKSDQDVVNLFTGFLLSPDQSIKDSKGNVVKSNLQKAYHVVAGVEVDVDKVEINFEPWVKYFGQVIEINRNKLLPQDADFVAASGLASGIDVSVKYSVGRIYIWGAAGYQNVSYTSIDVHGNEQTYPTPFDTRFNANALFAYTAGKKKDWDLSARFNVHSPFPFTQTQGFYENVSLASSPAADPMQQNGTMGISYSDQINGGRLSWYHRMDISARKRITLNKKSSFDITLAFTNVYNRNNIFYVNRVTNVKIYQLPIFPSLNVTWNF